MKKLLDDFYPYHWDTTVDYFAITIYPTYEDKMNRINGKEYRYTMSLNPNIPDYECCKVRIDGKYYYFG